MYHRAKLKGYAMRFTPIAPALACLLTGAALTGCAAPAPQKTLAEAGAEAARCFRTDQVRNFRAERPANLYVRSVRGDVFEINTSGGCWDLDSAISIAITPTAGVSENVCVGDPVNILVPSATPGNRTCRAFITRSLTEAEVEALPDRARP
ncbi:MAG: hypothetical protein CL682_12385 [Brevundimonas sp.]|nr:hypothetical protein [Brevundimonas sp.]